MNDLLTTGDVARLCEIPYITAYNWVKSGKIKSTRTPGGHYRIRRCDFVQFLEGYGFTVSDDLKQWRKRRILIVSEQPDNIERMLQSADGSYEIASANEGFSAPLFLYLKSTQEESFRLHKSLESILTEITQIVYQQFILIYMLLSNIHLVLVRS